MVNACDIELHIARRLHQRRRLLGLTLGQVAEVVGVRFQQIQKYECGSNRISAARLWQLSQALQVPMSYFFTGLAGKTNITAIDKGVEVIADAFGRQETRELVRAYYQLGERPRRQLLDFAKALNTDAEAI